MTHNPKAPVMGVNVPIAQRIVPRALLEGIEWVAHRGYGDRCPHCDQLEDDGHTPTCWIGLALGRKTTMDDAKRAEP